MTQNHPLKIGIVCGEHSGDRLGAELITELKRTHNLDLFGVGGPKLEALGVSSLFNFSEINLPISKGFVFCLLPINNGKFDDKSPNSFFFG